MKNNDLQLAIWKCEETERQRNAYKKKLDALWSHVKPKVGEVWEKKPCGNGICSMGHSLGVGVHTVTGSGYDWGTIEQMVCGCLVQLEAKSAMDDLLREFIELQDKLLIAYRCGKQPAGKVLDRLAILRGNELLKQKV